ncbi:DASS family sodium-coupled anion symporter [Teredinibacter sp. KSP-S5-2]|uniref:SLC13 family permease n=1 Tax=Teredinibacter sp. KSP-S5-2 TaxID=3034506 RepID=UPI002934A129|nr:DASS family sodium-coupled anion symporter [Teredinibacter sp. KSP-S5-2]WNO10100.1 DASS family sodium-coupled anion symporter [Teredinibacter sp. KSP-S5-2]
MSSTSKSDHKRIISLLSGPAILLFCLIIPPPFEGMPVAAWQVTGLAIMMAVWWTTEAVPIPVTALIPIVLAPLLGTADVKTVTAAFAHPLIYLFLGGFMLSLAMEKCHLHKRIALLALLASGSKPKMQIAGVMIITAFLSMWMSNTATSVMMLPIGLSIIGLVKAQDDGKNPQDTANFSTALLLSIAYSASIGGVGTLIGTPPNALLAAYLSEAYGYQVGFAKWMIIGLPVSLIMLLFCWLWLTQWGYKLSNKGSSNTEAQLKEQIKNLGKMTQAEKYVAIIFVITAVSWMTRPLLAKWSGLQITDTGIAIAAGIILFTIPANMHGKKEYLLDWENTKKLPWGILLLFGGGLSLAGMIKDTGLATYIADAISHNSAMPLIAMALLVTAVVGVLTNFSSNTATAAGFLPLLGPVSMSFGDSPLLLTVPAALAASCAFLTPIATPPNSIVFASGELTIKQMMKTGIVLNVFATILIGTIGLWLIQTFFA